MGMGHNEWFLQDLAFSEQKHDSGGTKFRNVLSGKQEYGALTAPFAGPPDLNMWTGIVRYAFYYITNKSIFQIILQQILYSTCLEAVHERLRKVHIVRASDVCSASEQELMVLSLSGRLKNHCLLSKRGRQCCRWVRLRMWRKQANEVVVLPSIKDASLCPEQIFLCKAWKKLSFICWTSDLYYLSSGSVPFHRLKFSLSAHRVAHVYHNSSV